MHLALWFFIVGLIGFVLGMIYGRIAEAKVYEEAAAFKAAVRKGKDELRSKL